MKDLSLVLRISAAFLTLTNIAQADPTRAALDFLKEHDHRLDQDLIQLASIPSISSLPEHKADVQKAAEWVGDRMKSAGLEKVQYLDTGAAPLVYAEHLHAPGKPTALIYAHYDVQPVDPLSLWKQPPFKPSVDEKYFNGRGVDDDKGGLLIPIQAVEALLKTSGKLPINVKFMYEGEEEILSPHLPAALAKHKKLLAADFALSADGGQLAEPDIGLCIGARGATAVEVQVRTLAGDQHSGMVGGSVKNAALALSEILAGLHHPNGSIAIPGFYDNMREITAEDKADVEAYPYQQAADYKQMGASEGVGEEGFSALERRWYRPTLDVVGMWSGFQGQGMKTIVPAIATAKVSCRLVPGQDPARITKLLVDHLQDHPPAGSIVTATSLKSQAEPYFMPKESFSNQAAIKAMEKTFNQKPFIFLTGGSVPAWALFETELGIKTTPFAFGRPDDNVHAPNERFPRDLYRLGRESYVRIFEELANPTSSQSDSSHASDKSEL